MGLLRFIIAGSVDDGKSTLTGRLLYDSGNICSDQLSGMHSDDTLNFAFLTDGLREEREKGITIDVGYRFFRTPGRKFILADAPGHARFTASFVTGASNCHCIVILVDACEGRVEQTSRHTILASLMGIPHVILAVNKMDKVSYSRQAFDTTTAEFLAFVKDMNTASLTCIPISALKGDNVVRRSEHMPWYEGETLLTTLEHITVENKNIDAAARFPVQSVVASERHDITLLAGRVSSGQYQVNDEVIILPSMDRAIIQSVSIGDSHLKLALSGQSIVMQLAGAIPVERGCMVVRESNMPVCSNKLIAIIIWLSDIPLETQRNYLFQHRSKRTAAEITGILYRLDIATNQKDVCPGHIGRNDIAKVIMETSEPIHYDPFHVIKENGHAILIDPVSFDTIGACLLQAPVKQLMG